MNVAMRWNDHPTRRKWVQPTGVRELFAEVMAYEASAFSMDLEGTLATVHAVEREAADDLDADAAGGAGGVSASTANKLSHLSGIAFRCVALQHPPPPSSHAHHARAPHPTVDAG